MTTLERLYPNYVILGLEEMLVEGVGEWYKTLVTDELDIMLIAKRGTDGDGRKIRVMCLKLESPFGEIVWPDFKPEELYKE